MTTLSVRYAPTLLLLFLHFPVSLSCFFVCLSHNLSMVSFLSSLLLMCSPIFSFCYIVIMTIVAVSQFRCTKNARCPVTAGLWGLTTLCTAVNVHHVCFNNSHMLHSPQRPSSTSYTWEYKLRNPYNHFQVSTAEMSPVPTTVPLLPLLLTLLPPTAWAAKPHFHKPPSCIWSCISCVHRRWNDKLPPAWKASC